MDSHISGCSVVGSDDFRLLCYLNRFENYSFAYIGRVRQELGDVIGSFPQASCHLSKASLGTI